MYFSGISLEKLCTRWLGWCPISWPLANTKWADGFFVCASGCQELLSRRSGEELREQEGLLQVQWYPHIHGKKKTPNMWQFVKEIFTTKYCFAPSWTGSWLEGIHCLLPFPYPSCEPGKPCPRSQTGSKIKASNFLGSRGCVPMVTFCLCPCALKIHIVGSWIHWVGWIGKRCPCHGCWSLVVVQQAFRLSEIFTRTSKWSWWSLRTDVNPQKSGKIFFDEANNWKELFFSIFFGKIIMAWFCIMILDQLDGWNFHDVPRDLQMIEVSKFSFLGPSWGSPKLDGCTFPPLNSRITRTTMSLLQESYVVFAMQSI